MFAQERVFLGVSFVFLDSAFFNAGGRFLPTPSVLGGGNNDVPC